jgi:ABC-type multidrug transport system permease subunit
MWVSLGAAPIPGYLLGKLFGGFSVEVVLVSVVLGILVFIFLSYFTAPIRHG